MGRLHHIGTHIGIVTIDIPLACLFVHHVRRREVPVNRNTADHWRSSTNVHHHQVSSCFVVDVVVVDIVVAVH